MENQKTCPFCAEQIRQTAKLCPRCRQWLTLRSIRHPVICMLIGVLPLLLGAALFIVTISRMFDNIGNPGPYYSAFASPLTILESNMNWAETSSGLRIYLTGVLTNESFQAWKDVEVECRFYDRTGNLIDAANGLTRFTVLPESDSAFRVSVTPSRATNDYAGYRVSVSNARNAKSWF